MADIPQDIAALAVEFVKCWTKNETSQYHSPFEDMNDEYAERKLIDFIYKEPAIAYLRMFCENVHGIEIKDRLLAKYLREEGFVTWLPPMFGSNRLHAITDKGKEWLKENTKP